MSGLTGMIIHYAKTSSHVEQYPHSHKHKHSEILKKPLHI